jgi:hypothetical protein
MGASDTRSPDRATARLSDRASGVLNRGFARRDAPLHVYLGQAPRTGTECGRELALQPHCVLKLATVEGAEFPRRTLVPFLRAREIAVGAVTLDVERHDRERRERLRRVRARRELEPRRLEERARIGGGGGAATRHLHPLTWR